MKKQQKINKAVNHGEWLLLGLTALFLCFLFVMRERPAPTRGIAVRTSAVRVPDAAPDVPASGSPDSDSASENPDSGATPDGVPDSGGASESAAASASDSVPVPAPDADDGRVNINTAGLSELCGLPGVGEALAGRIIDYRESHGPFARPEDVMRVAGIGEGKFAAMQGLITV